jgi:SAM-dependent methyltransferase
MEEHQDAYGHAIYDHLHGRGGYEIVERDDGLIAPSGGPPMYFAPYKEWPTCQQEAMAYVRGRVLDVGCGAGRVSLYLQEQGHDVTGIDVSPLAIQTSRERGVKDARVMPVTQISRRMGTYDSIVMMGNNFGLFGGRTRCRWLLGRMNAMTSPEARIIAESNDPYQTDNPHHLGYHQLNRERGRMGGQLRIRVRYQVYATPWFDYLMASRDEVRALLEGTAWDVERFIDGPRATYVAVMAKRD